MKIDIAIIGGSGLYKLDGMTDIKEVSVSTPFGKPSDNIITGKINGVRAGFLARHNRKHTFLPTEVPYRANIYALKKLGARVILAFGAVGSLREEVPPKSFVFPHQLIDKTTLRPNTFLGNGIAGHASFANPFCGCVQKVLFDTAKKLKIKCKNRATLIAMEGPVFSTRAESEFHRKMGWDLIGMTACPETKLAREAGIAFGQISMVTDFDSWKVDEEVTVEKVNETMKYNEIAAKKLILAAAPVVAKLKRCGACNMATRPFSGMDTKHFAKIKLVFE